LPLAVLASIMAKALVLANAVSDYWVIVSWSIPNADCFPAVNTTVTECGQQLGSMLVWIVLTLVKYGAPVSLEVLQSMVVTHVSV
jgi:hypothetical protein